jgi:hypothetical protein
MGKNKRRKIPKSVEAEVMYQSDRKCCVCQDQGVHIHHLDNKNNNEINNLALLCFKCHDEATKTGSLSRKLSKETIIIYRKQHYQVIKNKRQKALGIFNHKIKSLSEEDLLTASKNAIIIIELEKIKEEYFKSEWNKKAEVLGQIFKYHSHSNHRLAYEIFGFLRLAANQTRSGMTDDVANSIFSAVIDFCPSFYEDEHPKQTEKIGEMCIKIGELITYDSLIKLGDLKVAMSGLTIIKYIYQSAKMNDKENLADLVKKTYDNIERHLDRPERNDLNNAKELVKIFKDDLEYSDISWPPLPQHLMELTY